MQSVPFVFGDRATVPGWIGTDVQMELLQHVLDIKPDKVLLVTDPTVDALHGDYFAPLLESKGAAPAETGSCCPGAAPEVFKKIVPCGDACKDWGVLHSLFEWAFSVGATKRTVVVAVGGGAICNLTGLFASMLYRGSKLVYVPTTLLAMHDVTTSLKTSICFDGRKNNVGSFFAPVKILIEVAFCRTLPRGELFSGLGELAKNAALLGGKHAEGFCKALSRDRINSEHGGSGEEFAVDDATMSELLTLGIDAKMIVLADDAYERNAGMIFEYGHTISHALEKGFGDGTIPHGLGVVYGMLSSSYAAEKLGLMTPKARKEHDDLCWILLHRWHLPEQKPTIEKIVGLALRDSKRGICGEGPDEVADVLVRSLGDFVETNTQNLSKFPVHLVEEWLVEMGFQHETKH